MDQKEIVRKLAAGEIDEETANRLLNELNASRRRGRLYCKVSEKGACSVYGLQRMPVTLYVEQWQRLLDFGDEIRKFLKEHDAQLKKRDNGPDEQ